MAIQKPKKVTVMIGRFNPLHLGHCYVLNRALETSHHVIVLVGSSGQARSIKNPFSFIERKQMIMNWLATNKNSYSICEDFTVLPIYDHPYSDNTWIAEVQQIVNDTIFQHHAHDTVDISLTGSDRDQSTWYLKSFPQWKLDLVPEHDHAEGAISATGVRDVLYTSRLLKDDFAELIWKIPMSTNLFLQKFAESGSLKPLQDEYAFIQKYKKAWSVAPYAPTFNTADAVVIQSGHVLVVVRGANPGKGLWALPGGFVNQTETVEAAAIRELIEETGIRLTEGKKSLEITKSMLKGSIESKEIFDKPDRSTRGRTITVAYLFKLDDTKPLPLVKGQNVPAYESNGKDIVETEHAFWLPLNTALEQTDKWFEDHHAILETMVR